MTEESIVSDRLRALPPIRRARLWRLYAESRGGESRRFLDLWMDGGRAILGAKGTGLGTAAKAAIDMGLLRPLPSAWERRLAAQLRIAYPEYQAARFFRTDERALSAAGAARAFDPARREGAATGGPAQAAAAHSGPAPGGPESAGAADPARAADSRRVLVLRPFAELLGDFGAEAFQIALPLLPCPSALAPSVLLFRDEKAAAGIEGDVLPPALLSAAHRALCELIRMRDWYCEDLWKKADRRLGKHFERKGPYLYLRDRAATGDSAANGGAPSSAGAVAAVSYGAAFDAALKTGVLLSPDPELPSIIPGDFDDGEFATLAAALAAPQRT